jgi:hypothetical protein
MWPIQRVLGSLYTLYNVSLDLYHLTLDDPLHGRGFSFAARHFRLSLTSSRLICRLAKLRTTFQRFVRQLRVSASVVSPRGVSLTREVVVDEPWADSWDARAWSPELRNFWMRSPRPPWRWGSLTPGRQGEGPEFWLCSAPLMAV